MIQPNQKMLLHLYKAAARLNDPTYRNFLRQSAGVASAADPEFTQAGFEAAMASLETVLFQRVHAKEVESPVGKSRYILEEFYWRRKLPRDGMINSRQAHRIDELWRQICAFLPPEKRTADYQAAIVARATGQASASRSALTFYQANNLIDALKDRLAHALKSANHPELVPA